MAEFAVALPLLLSAWLAALLVPGPDTVLVAHVAAGSGRRAGFAAAAGVGVGIGLWAAAAQLGLALLFAEAGWLYRAVVLLGAAFLVLTGARMALAAWRGGAAATAGAAQGLAAWAAFRRGLATNLSNAKAAAFFTGLFGALLPPHPGLGAGLLVVLLLGGTAAGWYVILAIGLSRAPVAAAYQRAARPVQAVVGALLAGLGLRLAWGAR